MSDERELRAAAEKHLRALAGGHARLREDQWDGDPRPVADRRRALVGQRTGWGKSAVDFVATALLRAAGGGPDRDRLAAARLMRDQVGAARRASNAHDQLRQPRRLGQVYTEVATARSTCCWSAPSASTTPGSATTCCLS